MNQNMTIKRIVVIGNSGGGKTVLSRQLAKIHNLPITHVDSIQFIPGMQVRSLEETRDILNEITSQETWLIDGYGPLDLIEQRFNIADKIVFVDFPLWRHYWFCVKRQIKSIWAPRLELPEGCDEATIQHTVKLFRTLWRVHTKMRPELLKWFDRENLKPKVVVIQNMNGWNQIFKNGV